MSMSWDDVQIEIPDRLDEVVEEALRQVTKIHHRRILKKACAGVGSFLVLIGAFLTFGFCDPALAAQIPFLGKIFEGAVQKGGPVAANLSGYDGMQYIGKEAESNNGYSLLISEAYSDGETVQIGLELTVPEELQGRYSEIEAGYGKTSLAKIGGEDAKILTVNHFEEQEGVWRSTMSIAVPESQRDEKKLEISFVLRDFSGRIKESLAENSVTAEPIQGDFTAEFSTLVDKEHTLFFESDAEDHGAQVLAVKASPAQTVITVTKPYWGGVFENEAADAPENHPQGYPHLYTIDGMELNANPRASADQGGYDFDLRETQTADLYFDGPPVDAKQLVLRFIYGDWSDEVLAEFTIDLDKRTVSPGSSLDEYDPNFYQTLQGSQTLPDKIQGYAVEHISFSRRFGREEAHIVISTPMDAGMEHLKFEARDSKGNLLVSTTSILEDGSWNDTEWWDFSEPVEFSEQDGTVLRRQASYSMTVPVTDMPPKGETVTGTLTDMDTGEVLCKYGILLDTVSE